MLRDGDTPVYMHQGKARLLHTFFSGLLGTAQPASYDFDLRPWLPTVHGVRDLDEPFTAADALWLMWSASSLGPDGFGQAFFTTFWP